MERKLLIARIGSLIGLAALTALLILWWRAESYGLWGRLAAVCSALLFALLGLRFVPRWVDFWSDTPLSPPPASDEPPRIGLYIFFSLLALDGLFLASGWLLRGAHGYSGGFLETLDFWRCTDSQHYLAIAEDWYLSEGSRDRLVQLVFLPGYPLVVRLFQLLTVDYLHAGLLVSAICFAGAGLVFYRLARLDLPPRDALRALVFLCLMPGSFFYAAPMSESLFLLLSLSCVYLARRDRWLWAALCGAWAAFTRSLGLMLLVPLLMELVAAAVRRERPVKQSLLRAASLLLIPLGFAAYCLINRQVSGHAFQFLVYQREHWGQRLGLFFNTAAYQTELAVSSFAESPSNFFGLWLPNLLYSLLSLALVALAAKRLRPSYTAWLIAYYVIAIGATWLLSAPRYLMAMPVLPLALARLTGRDAPKLAALIVLSACGTLYFLAFLQRWQVW